MSKTIHKDNFHLSETTIILACKNNNWLICLHAQTETQISFVTLLYSFLKNYSTSASNTLREAFYHHYLQTV